nr:AAC(3) family N-acetyltransferase [Listeria weihenstephanensis]
MKDVKRSSHPKYSFCAWGSDAAFITEKHALNFGFGEQSPLGRLYELQAKIVLFGVDHDKNTSLHLAEHRAKKIPHSTGAIANDGERDESLAEI